MFLLVNFCAISLILSLAMTLCSASNKSFTPSVNTSYTLLAKNVLRHSASQSNPRIPSDVDTNGTFNSRHLKSLLETPVQPTVTGANTRSTDSTKASKSFNSPTTRTRVSLDGRTASLTSFTLIHFSSPTIHSSVTLCKTLFSLARYALSKVFSAPTFAGCALPKYASLKLVWIRHGVRG